MIVHQAIFGEKNKAHNLLAKSSKDQEPFVRLIGRSDLPSSPPPNINWQPYISGFSLNKYYVFSITFPDSSTSRGGMVFTHALILDLNEAIIINNLNNILKFLPSSIQKEGGIESIIIDELDIKNNLISKPNESFPPGYSSLIKKLLNNYDYGKPIVWIGQESFTEAVTTLWTHLSPEIRKNYSFRLSFSPQDTEDQGLTIVSTPEKLENRWAGYPKVKSSDQDIPTLKSEALLHGLPEGENIHKIFSKLEVSPNSVIDLSKAETCCTYFESLTTADEARSLVRLLGSLSSNPNKGKQIKSEALQILADLSEKGSASDILALRNLDTQPFGKAIKIINEATTKWIKAIIYSAQPEKNGNSAKLVLKAYELSSGMWYKNIQESIVSAFADWNSKAALTIWRWWQNEPKLVELLDKAIPKKSIIEKDLISTVPKTISHDIAAKCLSFTKKRRFLLLHAAVLGASLDVYEAYKEQLKIDKNTSHFNGLKILSEIYSPKDTIRYSLKTGEERLLYISGELCAKNPLLLSSIDVEKKEWRIIWLYCIETNKLPWDGIPNSKKVLEDLVKIILKGENVSNSLLLYIANTPEGSLIDVPRRKEIWEKFDENVSKAFLNVTARDWLERFKENPNLIDTVEMPLESAILEEELLNNSIAIKHHNYLQLYLKWFSRFERLTEDRFLKWLVNSINAKIYINIEDSTLIGKLVVDRRWKRAASKIYRLEETGRKDLLPALKECKNLLGWYELFMIQIKGNLRDINFGENDLWNAFLTVAIQLYPRGLEDQHIWARSGGEISTVNIDKAGRDQWESAVILLKKDGGGTDINVKKILENMQRDFPNNKELNALMELAESFFKWEI